MFYLNVSRTNFSDLSILEKQKNGLNYLNIFQSDVMNLSKLSEFDGLRTLVADGRQVARMPQELLSEQRLINSLAEEKDLMFLLRKNNKTKEFTSFEIFPAETAG